MRLKFASTFLGRRYTEKKEVCESSSLEQSSGKVKDKASLAFSLDSASNSNANVPFESASSQQEAILNPNRPFRPADVKIRTLNVKMNEYSRQSSIESSVRIKSDATSASVPYEYTGKALSTSIEQELTELEKLNSKDSLIVDDEDDGDIDIAWMANQSGISITSLRAREDTLLKRPQMIKNWKHEVSMGKDSRLSKLHTKSAKVDDTQNESDALNISLTPIAKRNIERVPMIGKIVLPDQHFQVYEANVSKEFFELLEVTSYNALPNMIGSETTKLIAWSSPASSAIFDQTSNGILIVRKGNLFSLVGLLISEESFADSDYLKDMLQTYRYFSHPIDICRILVLRYMEIHHGLINQNSPLKYTGKTQKEGNEFIQMRILNVFKKWANEYTEDFMECRSLNELLGCFLVAYVKSDPKRSIFANCIFEKIHGRQNQKQKVTPPELDGPPLRKRDPLHKSERIINTRSEFVLNSNNVSMKLNSSFAQHHYLNTSHVANQSDEALARSYVRSGRSINNDLLNRSITSVKITTPNTLTKMREGSFDLDTRRSSASSVSSTQTNDHTFQSIADFDPDVLARQLTLLEQQQFMSIPIHEFYNQKWNAKVGKELLAPNLILFIRWFNHVASSFASEIVKQLNLKKRVNILKRIIYIAHFCLKHQNYNTCFEIVAGLNSTPVSRLKQTWKSLPKKYLEVWESLNTVVSNESSYKAYRACLINAKFGNKSIVPYLGVHLSDLTFAEDGNETYATDEVQQTTPTLPRLQYKSSLPSLHILPKQMSQECVLASLDLINFTKFKMISEILTHLKTLQRAPLYEFKRDDVAEEWILNKLVPLDEADMFTMSKQCEPKSTKSTF